MDAPPSDARVSGAVAAGSPETARARPLDEEGAETPADTPSVTQPETRHHAARTRRDRPRPADTPSVTQPETPSVVAVVVTIDPGPEFAETLLSLAAQDYANLDVLVIDDHSAVDPTAVVAATIPEAYVRRLDARHGYAGALNHAIEMIEGAQYLLALHDDTALASDAVRWMVHEALTAGADVVAPKLVSWEDHERLLAMGIGADRTARSLPLVERYERDQEQHDRVRDVFAAPSAAFLVRAELFAALGGLAAAYTEPGPDMGEDLEFGWRAQLAGARIVVAPEARVAHRERLHGTDTSAPGETSPRSELEALLSRSRRQERNRLLTLATYGRPLTKLTYLPILVLQTLLTLLRALWRGPTAAAPAALGAWTDAVRGLGKARARRRSLPAKAGVADRRHESARVKALMVPLRSRWQARLRNELVEDRAGVFALVSRTIADPLGHGARRWRRVSVVALGLVLLLGSRHLLFGRLPVIGQFVPSVSSYSLGEAFFSPWRGTGTGSASAAPPAFGLLAIAQLVFAGSTGGLLRLTLVAGLALGWIGIGRMVMQIAGRAMDRPAALAVRIVAGVAYAAVPVPYNAIANGHLDGLVLYAALPWLVGAAVRTSRFGSADGSGSPSQLPATRRGRWFLSARLGLPLAIVGAFAFGALPAMVLTIVGISVGALAGSPRPTRAVTLFAGNAARGVLVSAVLLGPWAFSSLTSGGTWRSLTDEGPVRAKGMAFAELLRWETGPHGGTPLGWALLLGAAVPLVLASGPRLLWAVRLWAVILSSLAVAWAGARGWLGGFALSPEVALAPAAMAAAASVALGLAGFVLDLREQRFGWRQRLVAVSAASLVASVLPLFPAAFGGRWGAPDNDVARALPWLRAPEDPDTSAAVRTWRTLWVAAAPAFVGSGWSLDQNTTYATTLRGLPSVLESWPGPVAAGTASIRDALLAARDQDTVRLGARLAPMAIRFVVVVERPGIDAGRSWPVDADLRVGLNRQLDLRLVDAPAGVIVYENAAYVALPGLVAPAVADSVPAPTAVESSLLAAVRPLDVRTDGTHSRAASLPSRPAPARLLLADSFDRRWHLSGLPTLGGPTRVFGWATALPLQSGDRVDVQISRSSSTPERVRSGGLAALWLLILVGWRRGRRYDDVRQRRWTPEDPADQDEPELGGFADDADGDNDELPPSGALADELWESFNRRRLEERRVRRSERPEEANPGDAGGDRRGRDRLAGTPGAGRAHDR